MTQKFLVLFLLIVMSLASIQSCKKKQDTKPAPAPYVDTMGLLTAHRWYVDYVWSDDNSNGIKDFPAELRPGALDFKLYSFKTDGTLADSIPNKVLPGTWHFKGVTKDSVYITIDTISADLYSIMAISETAIATKRWGTPQFWYFIKY